MVCLWYRIKITANVLFTKQSNIINHVKINSMTDLKLEELMRSLFDAKITKVYSYDKSTYRTFAIEEQG